MTRRILLADDSVTIQKVIELTFMDDDYEVTAVSNGDEAVASLETVRPDCVIADVHMPGANGYEVCRRAKAERPERPVLLLVGTFEPFDEAQSRNAGADAFLKKPFDSQELLHLVEQLLAGAPTTEVRVAEMAFEPSAEDDTPFPSAAAYAPPSTAEAFPPGPSASAFPPGPSAPAQEDPFGSLESAPTWSNFDLEEEAAPAAPAAGAVAAGWEETPAPAYSPPEEQVFELEEEGDVLALDDSLLDEVPPLTEAEAEGLALDDSYEREGWREGRAASPDAAVSNAGADLRGGVGSWFEATPEERAGVPLGAAPLASGLDEVESAVVEHEGAPAFAAASAFAVSVPAGSGAAHTAPAASGGAGLSDEDVERIARRVAELVSERVLRDVAWEVVPDMAELVIKDRLRELEGQVDEGHVDEGYVDEGYVDEGHVE